jgi:hypothetical protein
MKTASARKSRLAVVISITLMSALTSVAASANPAHKPHAASSTVTRTGPNGKSAVRQSSVATSGNGSYTAGSTVTGANGKTATREQSGAYDPSTQTFSREATATGPNGKQSTSSASVTRTDDGYARSATHTSPNGKTATSQGGATYDPATKTVTQGRTTTGPNGKSATESRTVQAGTPTSTP